MSRETDMEKLFIDHSLDEIESLKENLASEIEKRTIQLKSIVKEKYRDIVETSETIHSIKSSLKDLEQSLWSLDKSINEFYIDIKNPPLETETKCTNLRTISDRIDDRQEEGDIVKRLIEQNSLIWDYFDNNDIKSAIRVLKESIALADQNKNCDEVIGIKESSDMAVKIIKNHLWYRIQVAEPNQIGIIDGDDNLAFEACISFLKESFQKDILDTSYQYRLKKLQQTCYFNTQTNEVEKSIGNFPYVQIPKFISIDLDNYLYHACKSSLIIAGYNIDEKTRASNLELALESALEVYSLACAQPSGRDIKQDIFDLLYLKSLLSFSKDTTLMENLLPKIECMKASYEKFLDPIELYMISESLETQAMSLCRRTVGLFGLIIGA